jgi:hypothetical protein
MSMALEFIISDTFASFSTTDFFAVEYIAFALVDCSLPNFCEWSFPRLLPSRTLNRSLSRNLRRWRRAAGEFLSVDMPVLEAHVDFFMYVFYC